MDTKEIIFWNFKNSGGFPEYKNYKEYQNRNVKKEEPILVKTEAQKKLEEIELLKINYDPPPTDPKELEKYEEERRKKENEKWKLEHLITEHDKEIYKGLNGGTLEEREIKEKDLTPEELEKQRLIDEDNADTKAKYDKYLGKNKQ